MKILRKKILADSCTSWLGRQRRFTLTNRLFETVQVSEEMIKTKRHLKIGGRNHLHQDR